MHFYCMESITDVEITDSLRHILSHTSARHFQKFYFQFIFIHLNVKFHYLLLFQESS